jgi:hypothetical protein
MAISHYSGIETGPGGGISISPIPAIAIIPEEKNLLNGSAYDQNVNGSVTPQEFKFAPAVDEVYYLEHMTFGIDDTGSTPPNKYGAITALANGTQVILKVGGVEHLITQMKNNGDILLSFNFSVGKLDNGKFMGFANGFAGKMIYATNITLNGANGDEIKIKVQDNLTGLTFQRAAVQTWRLA